jgi:hypothetical protein
VTLSKLDAPHGAVKGKVAVHFAIEAKPDGGSSVSVRSESDGSPVSTRVDVAQVLEYVGRLQPAAQPAVAASAGAGTPVAAAAAAAAAGADEVKGEPSGGTRLSAPPVEAPVNVDGVAIAGIGADAALLKAENDRLLEEKKKRDAEEEAKRAAKDLDDAKQRAAEGFAVLKFGRHGSPHIRLVYVKDGVVMWCKKVDKSEQRAPELDKVCARASLARIFSRGLTLCSQSFKLADIKRIEVGKKTPVLAGEKKAVEALCMSLVTDARSLDFQCASVEQRADLVALFTLLRDNARGQQH